MMKVAFYTLGCKVNQYETQVLKENFKQRGYEIAEDTDFADVYIINTCTVTSLSDRKSRQYIRRMKRQNPKAVTAVIGCYAQVSSEEVKAIEGVDIVAGTNEKHRLVDYVEEYMKKREPIVSVKPYEELCEYEEIGSITSMESRTRAYIKIQEGCNRFCTYCVIPYARGSVRSRPKEEIIHEAKSLIGAGFKELVLTGINAALYGMEEDFPEEEEGCYGIEIIIKALNELPGKFRIRLSSLEPTVVNEEYVRGLLQYKKLCPHLHLSAQSGSDKILKTMHRRYDREEYLNIVAVLKQQDPGFGISTDIIVGFPGETEADFSDSMALVEKTGFCKVHVFKYSKRPMTEAALMKGHVSPEIKTRRSARLISLSEKVAHTFFEANAGQVREVLFEARDSESGFWKGYSDNFIEVYCDTTEELSNCFAQVKLQKQYKDGMSGKLMEKGK